MVMRINVSKLNEDQVSSLVYFFEEYKEWYIGSRFKLNVSEAYNEVLLSIQPARKLNKCYAVGIGMLDKAIREYAKGQGFKCSFDKSIPCYELSEEE